MHESLENESSFDYIKIAVFLFLFFMFISSELFINKFFKGTLMYNNELSAINNTGIIVKGLSLSMCYLLLEFLSRQDIL